MTHEHAFRVAQATDNHVPTVETDHNIPVLIHWVDTALRAGPLPVYVRVSGLADGELEFTIDPDTGELLRAIVLMLGAIAIEAPPPYPEVPVDEGCGLVIDRSLWAHSKEHVISLEWLLRFYRLPAGVRIDVAGMEQARLVECGPQVTIGLGSDGTLASIAARIDIDDRHFQT
jgi:hypothetical protein